MKQFAPVNCKFGAPMGRRESLLSDAPRSIGVYRVRLDRGGYDDGGAYWGTGEPLYRAVDDEGNQRFVRAATRLRAIAELGLNVKTLRKPPRAEYARIRYLESRGVASATGVLLRQKLDELGFAD